MAKSSESFTPAVTGLICVAFIIWGYWTTTVPTMRGWIEQVK
jgi:hypothetical protein